MDEIDGLFFGVALAALAVGVLLVALRVKDLEMDMELARMAGPVRTGGES